MLKPTESLLVCKYPVLPIRKEPSESSEMVSQILFGETAVLLDTSQNWHKIRMNYDGYEGWVNSKGMMQNHKSSLSADKKVVTDLVLPIEQNGQRLLLPAGAELEINTPEPTRKPEIESIVAIAKSLLGIPYLWGGRSSYGFDCSGFVQIVYKIHGISLPRDSKDQIKLGADVNLLNEIKPADLAFFTSNGEMVSHVGILIDNQTIIHASGFVRIDFFDHLGIFNREIKEYTHKLLAIKRIL